MIVAVLRGARSPVDVGDPGDESAPVAHGMITSTYGRAETILASLKRELAGTRLKVTHWEFL
jgi:hypothetical protein